jgi:hypothetical protein
MCEVRSRKNSQEQKKEKKYNGQQQKEMDCDEPYSTPNEKTQGIQWTEWPTGALVVVGSLWPSSRAFQRCAALHLHTSGSGRFLTFCGWESNC